MRAPIIPLIIILLSISCDTLSQEKSLTFTGSTPCGQGKMLLPAVPVDAPCEFMKWHLTLFFTTGNLPSTYTLSCQYGMTKAGTTDFLNKQKVEMSGSWRISHGIKSNENAIVYQLGTDGSTKVSFVKFSNDILHLLDNERQLMIGNPGWSFTLNRVIEKR
jgi:hypothetical protein